MKSTDHISMDVRHLIPAARLSKSAPELIDINQPLKSRAYVEQKKLEFIKNNDKRAYKKIKMRKMEQALRRTDKDKYTQMMQYRKLNRARYELPGYIIPLQNNLEENLSMNRKELNVVLNAAKKVTSYLDLEKFDLDEAVKKRDEENRAKRSQTAKENAKKRKAASGASSEEAASEEEASENAPKRRRVK